MSFGTRDNSEVDRAMDVLTGNDEEEITIKTYLVERVLNHQSLSAAEKVAEILEICKRSRENARSASMQKALDAQRDEIIRLRNEPNYRGARFSSPKKTAGVYIRSVEAGNHPMIRNSSIVKTVLIMFGMLLVTEPLFIGISNDMQTMSLAFFVITLLLGGYISFNFVETREQELLMSIAEIDETQMEPRKPMLVYSFMAFIGSLFVQLVYALYVARTVVSTSVVVLVTFLSCAMLFASFVCLVRFEREYVMKD